MLLDPLRRGHVILLLEGSVEDGFAFEARAFRYALDGGVQVCPCTQQGDGMRHAQFIPIAGEGGLQFLIEAVGDTDTGDVECLRNVVQRKIRFEVGLFSFDVENDALKIR